MDQAMGQSGLILTASGQGSAPDLLRFGREDCRDDQAPDLARALQNAVRLMLAAAGPCFVIWGKEQRLFGNDAYLALTQQGPRPSPDPRFRCGRDFGPDAAALARGFEGQPVLLPEVTLPGPGGGHRVLTVSVMPILSPAGVVLGLLCTAADITTRILREQHQSLLLELEEELRRQGPTDALRAVAPRLGPLLGVSRIGHGRRLEGKLRIEVEADWTAGSLPSLAGQHDMCLFGDKLWSGAEGAVLASHDSGGTAEMRAALTVTLGEGDEPRTLLFLHAEATRNWQSDELALVEAMARQLHSAEQRRAREAMLRHRMVERTAELERTEDALRQAQKMEAIGQLTGGIAHDFNNLLQGISGSLDLIQTRIAQGRLAAVGPFLKSASASATRATALTHRLLAFARRQPIDPRPVQVNGLIENLRSLLRRSCGEAVQLELGLEQGLWGTLCDSNQLENALLNLAINARDAMPDGGGLLITTAGFRHAGRDPALRDLDAGDYVVIRVRDTGHGMPASVVERAFEPFFTTKPAGQGTGLGLSMIYGFARQSKGTVRILSASGEGTTVELYLPRHDRADTAPPPDMTAPEPPRRSTGEVVVVVEDDPVVRQLVVEVLGEQGYAVLQAEDGHAGQRLIEKLSRLDLLVTDIGLPGPDGLQLAALVRQRQPEARILFMTGYAEAAARGEGFLQKGMEMVVKPFAMDDLAARVHALLEPG
ncbi:response regulator [Teichococcus vastitatis]|uniref:histidine kinase n=1 Tax=Teichococcus vastitatis TaxID=2307076 RepID=A0ABS9W1T5_9PROT|nr:response regulator [Pseudoroseomonas vastitatis]MCI0753008.1 response regulator [Pseudoroseomonas vastitatis]